MRENYSCPCPQCAGDEPVYSRHTRYCLQCGAALWPDTDVYAGTDGEVHSECLAEYLLQDATRSELLDFAEQSGGIFRRFMLDTRDLTPERLPL